MNRDLRDWVTLLADKERKRIQRAIKAADDDANTRQRAGATPRELAYARATATRFRRALEAHQRHDLAWQEHAAQQKGKGVQ
jgi:hypothetical protein